MTTNKFQANSRLSVWPKLLNIIVAYHHKVVQNILLLTFYFNRTEQLCVWSQLHGPSKCFCDKNILFCIPQLFCKLCVFVSIFRSLLRAAKLGMSSYCGEAELHLYPSGAPGENKPARWGGGVQNERGRDRVCQKRLEKKNEETAQHSSDQSQVWTAVMWKRSQTHWRGTAEDTKDSQGAHLVSDILMRTN